MKLFKRRLCILLFSFTILTQIYSIVSYASIQFGKNEISNNIYSDCSNSLNSDELEVLTLINNYRNNNNQTNLIPLMSLQAVAYTKANDLVENDYFSHTSPCFGSTFTLIQQQNIAYTIAGENLAGNISANTAVEAWINSPSHKENILTSDFKYTGIAIVSSEKYGKIYVQLFMG